jgi:predicted nucleic acid-binding protein
VKSLYLLDSGPLVAYLDRNDHFHAWADKIIKEISSPLLTCEAVLTETRYLVANPSVTGYDLPITLTRRRAS